jgi:hypothetical protein
MLDEMGAYLMRVTPLLLTFFVFAGSSMAPAAIVADLAVFNVIRQTDSTLVSHKVIYRNAVSSDLDLVIAIASTANVAAGSDSIENLWWDENRKLGLFLQEKARPNRVYLLALDAGPDDCGARIERATATDTVITCTGEKGYQGMNQKFVYDVRAKALVRHFAYQPFMIMRVLNDSGRTVFVGIDEAKLVAVEFQPDESPELRILSGRDAAPWLARVRTSRGTEGMEQRQVLYLAPENPAPLRFGEANAFTFTRRYMDTYGKEYPSSIVDSHGKQYPLPQSTYDDFARARPERVLNGYVREGTTIEETIGSVQPEGDKLWFGKGFYDGEGNSGVGGFGYFDATDRQYHLFALPEVADFSISPILVQPDVIWMNAFWACEYGCPPGKVLRYDRKSQAIRKYELPDNVYGFVASGNRLLAYTNFGIAVIEDNQTRRYFVDRTTDGRLRIAQATR